MTLLPSAVEIANQIRLLRSHHRGSFLLLEGRTDRLFYERFIAPEACKIIVCYGKEKVLQATRTLERSSFNGILGIVDADFDRLSASSAATTNIAFNDCHDLEASIVRSSAFENVLRELASPEKLDALERAEGIPLREVLLRAAAPIGYLRWYSIRSGLSLCFDGLRFARFLEPTSLTVNETLLVQSVKDLSQGPDLSVDTILEDLRLLAVDNHDLWEICNGHDLVEILSIALRRTIGSQTALTVSSLALERELRIGVDPREFERWNIYAAVRNWESESQGFRIFATP